MLWLSIAVIALAIGEGLQLLMFRRSEKERHLTDVLSGQVFIKQSEFNAEVISTIAAMVEKEKK